MSERHERKLLRLATALLEAQTALAELIEDPGTDGWQPRSIDQHVRNAWNEYAAWMNGRQTENRT